MLKWTGSAIVVSLLWLVVSLSQRDALPAGIDYVPGMAEEPLQRATDARPFDVAVSGRSYRIAPEYTYDLTGMVVSYRHHDGSSRLHRGSNDHLNMLDVCVIWGDNVNNNRLSNIRFWNGIFTCRVETRDEIAWRQFDMHQLSNNHLLSDDPGIRQSVRRLRVGDQIRVRGLLASYETSTGATRGTSTTRTDTGDGACETLYVEQFDVLRRSASGWRISSRLAGLAVLILLGVHILKPYQPY